MYSRHPPPQKRIYYCYTECISIGIAVVEQVINSVRIPISSFGILVTYLQEKQLYHFLQ